MQYWESALELSLTKFGTAGWKQRYAFHLEEVCQNQFYLLRHQSPQVARKKRAAFQLAFQTSQTSVDQNEQRLLNHQKTSVL